MMREPYYLVVQDHPFELPVKPQGIPTPMLVSLGRAEAYFVPSPTDPSDGHWRARDDAYDAVHAPGVQYQRVRVIQNPKVPY